MRVRLVAVLVTTLVFAGAACQRDERDVAIDDIGAGDDGGRHRHHVHSARPRNDHRRVHDADDPHDVADRHDA